MALIRTRRVRFIFHITQYICNNNVPYGVIRSIPIAMNIRPLSLLLIAFALACGQATEAPLASTVARTVNEVAISEGTPVTTADLEISGMSCMMSCGHAVEKALAALPGISKTTIQFNEGDAADHAIVTYDEAQVTDQQMIDAVAKVHDGAYKVVAVSITKQKLDATGAPAPEAGGDQAAPADQAHVEAAPDAGEVGGLIPGLLELLSRVARI